LPKLRSTVASARRYLGLRLLKRQRAIDGGYKVLSKSALYADEALE
jgi:hypothetical protein